MVSASITQMIKRYGFIYIGRNDDESDSLTRYKKESLQSYKKIECLKGQYLSSRKYFNISHTLKLVEKSTNRNILFKNSKKY